MFNPEQVRRYKPIEYDDMPGEMVTGEAYDLLLALYTSESDARRMLAAKLAISSKTFAKNKLRPRLPWDSIKASIGEEIKGEPI